MDRAENSKAALPRVLASFVGVIALAVGVSVYIMDRRASSVYFLPVDWSFADGSSFFGPVGGVLPDFAHVYAFSLLTALVLGVGRRRALGSCAAWAGLDGIFELGQHEALGPQIAAAIGRPLNGIPFLENGAAYFLQGTFDPWDLVAFALGGLAAYGTLAPHGNEPHDVDRR